MGFRPFGRLLSKSVLQFSALGYWATFIKLEAIIEIIWKPFFLHFGDQLQIPLIDRILKACKQASQNLV
jgi:hypothetical protein